MRLTRNPSSLPRPSTSAMTRAWSAGEGCALAHASGARPAEFADHDLLAGKIIGDVPADRRDMIGGLRSPDRIVLPVRQDVHGDEIDRARELAIANPELPDVGIGDRHFHLGLHARDVFAQGRNRNLAAQQRFVADDHRAHGVGIVGAGDRDAGGDLVLRAVRKARNLGTARAALSGRAAARSPGSDRGRHRPHRCARNR